MNPQPVSKGRLWTGRVLSALPVLFLSVDGIMKLIEPKVVVDSTIQLGYQKSIIPWLGILLLSLVLLYIFPRTSVLGAILLTGYLGGAVASQARVNNPLVTHILFPIYLGALLWGGLYFRDPRLHALVPLRALADRTVGKNGPVNQLRS